MRRADTFIRKKANLLYDLVSSIKELYHAIYELTGNPEIDFKNAYDNCTERIRTTVFGNYFFDTKIEWGVITGVTRFGESIIVRAENPSGDGARAMDIYSYSIDEMVDIYEQLENVYNYEKSRQ